ncbi:hypothetical protein ACVXZZ_10425 [Staphylococcus aureus]
MSVNMGGFIITYFLQHFVNVKNFHGGFLIAAVGMALGLVWYVLFNRKNLGSVGMKPTNPLTPAEKKKVWSYYRKCCFSNCINYRYWCIN